MGSSPIKSIPRMAKGQGLTSEVRVVVGEVTEVGVPLTLVAFLGEAKSILRLE